MIKNDILFYKNKDFNIKEDEVWKPINGYSGHYHISNYGRVKVVVNGKDIRVLSQKERVYPVVILSKNGIKKHATVHRLVAKAFIPLLEGKPHVNHKDGNKYNNLLSNLEWCTPKENAYHSVHILGNTPPIGVRYLVDQYGANNQRAKAIIQMKNGNIIAEYSCINEATQKTGIIHSGISRCCNGKQRTSKGFEWKYK